MTEISDYAFDYFNFYTYSNNLKYVVLGSNLTKIGNACMPASIKKIVIKSTKLKTVDSEALKNVPSSAVIQLPKSKLKSYKKLLNVNGKSYKLKTVE